MKRIKWGFFALSLLCGFMMALQAAKPLKIQKKDGAAPGYTGSPGDSSKNCTACHGGTATPVKKWFRSNIPAEGYTPGSTYTITAYNKVVGATRFGFEFSPQDLAGNLLGSIVVTDSVKTKFVGGSKYITYTNDGIASVDSMQWTFDWVAPKAGTGTVGFYGAFNSNFNHNKSNDQTFIGSQMIKENINNGIVKAYIGFQTLKLYPNPATSNVEISLSGLQAENLRVDVFDLKGTEICNWVDEKATGVFSKMVNTNTLPNGIYLIRVSTETKSEVLKLSIIN